MPWNGWFPRIFVDQIPHFFSRGHATLQALNGFTWRDALHHGPTALVLCAEARHVLRRDPSVIHHWNVDGMGYLIFT